MVSRCPRTVKLPRSARIRSPTTRTCMRSSVPDSPKTVTLITNFVPLQDPPGGPNFFEFGDDVLYSIYIDNDGDGRTGDLLRVPSSRRRSATRTRSSTTRVRSPSLDSPNWNRRQFYSVTRVDGRDTDDATATGQRVPEAEGHGCSAGTCACPPCNIGPRSTPNYDASLGQPAVHDAARWHEGVRRTAAGRVLRRPRRDLRPRRPAAVPEPASDPQRRLRWAWMRPRRSTSTRSRMQVPISDLTASGSVPTDADELACGDRRLERRRAVARCGSIDELSNGGRRSPDRGCRSRVWAIRCSTRWSCRWARRTGGTRRIRSTTRRSPAIVEHPELAKLLPALYPGVFPNLAALSKARARPGGDPAHGDPGGDHSRVPELHRAGARPTSCA